jgi:Tol biopolymer transport system component
VYEQFGPGQKGLLIKNTLNGNVRQLTVLSDDIDSGVTWSPNGKKLLFNDSADQVYTIWPDGSHRAVISDGDSRNAVWSPDGTSIAFIEDDGISVSGVDGTVTQIYPGNTNRLVYLSWSPDGSKIAFVSNDATGSSSINTLDIASQTVKQIAWPTSRPDGLSWQARP